MTENRKLARALFDAGVAAADPYTAVQSHIHTVDEPSLIVAVGKAARRMAQAAIEQFAGVTCIVVTNYENAKDLAGAQVFAAGHPVPDANGARAAAAVLDAVRAADGPLLALISGGGSALLPAPVDGVSLNDKADLNSALLGSGLDIVQMNLVRQQVSRIKGGGLLRAAAPHLVTALILSDVIGDDLSAIASGPTVPPLGTAAEAMDILKSNALWGGLPASIKAHLSLEQTPPDLPEAANILVGSNAQSLSAMAKAAPQAKVLGAVEGDVAQAARYICANAGPHITLWGGETTVVLKGDGLGGRNQELAVRIAAEAARLGWQNWVCLQGGTDGRDGPTDAAGGLVDHGTCARIVAAGGDVDAFLANNDCYHALQQAGDLLITGATGTNVADLGVLIRTPS